MRKVKRIYAKIGKYEHAPAKVFAIGLKGFYAFRALWPILYLNT